MREKSPFMAPLPHKNEAGVRARRREFLQTLTKELRALRLVQVVKDAHLGAIVRAFADLLRAVVGEARVVGRAVSRADEPRQRAVAIGLAFEAGRRPRAARHVREADAADLTAGHEHQ